MKLAVLTFAAALAAATLAQAQAPASSPGDPTDIHAARAQVREACAADVQKLCADKQGREIRQCLQANLDKASSACRDAISKMPRRGHPR